MKCGMSPLNVYKQGGEMSKYSKEQKEKYGL